MKIKKKYYKRIERLLYNYNMLRINIQIADKQLENLKEEDGMHAINYDKGKISNTFKVNCPTEETAIKNIEKETLIVEKREKLISKLETLQLLISGLSDIERKIIDMYYIEGKQWWQIAYEVKYSERHCRRIRSDAIGKLAVGLYGVEVLE